MANIDLRVKLEGLGIAVEEMADEIMAELQRVAETVALAAYNMGVTTVQQKLHSTRLDYLSKFHYKKLSANEHLIYLDPEANHLEEGYASFDMKPGLLAGPKARVTSKGTRINIVPFRHKATTASATNLHEQLMATEIQQALKSARDRSGNRVDLRKTQRGPNGKALQGVVGRVSGANMHQNIQGLTKIQKTYGDTTQSTLLTFRTVSSKSDANSWIHPGFDGVKVFSMMQRWANQEVDRVLRTRFIR